jgi:hypothetical protein
MTITDAWPEPDQSTIENAAMVLVEEHGYFDDAERAEVLAKVLTDPAFKLVVSTVWAGRLPTPDAYRRADDAYNKRLAQVNQVGAVLNTWQTWREGIQDGEPEAVFYDEVLAAVSGEATR